MELAEAINSKPLPPVSQRHGLLLPPDEDALLAQNMQLHVRPGRLTEASAAAQPGNAGSAQPQAEVLPLGATSRGAVLPRPVKHQAFTVKQTSPARALREGGAEWQEGADEGSEEPGPDQEQGAAKDTEMKEAAPDEDDLAKELEAGLEDEEWV